MQKTILRLLLVLGLAFPLFFLAACSSSDSEDEIVAEDETGATDDDASSEEEEDDSGDTDSSSSSSSFREESDDTSSDPSGTFDYSILNDMGHPRLLMTDDDFTTLKTRVSSGRFSNKTLYKIHKKVIELADEYAESTEEVTYTLDSSNKRLTQYTLPLRRLFACAYAYRMTGTAKYLTRAVTDLETVCAFTDWNDSKHFLGAAEIALGVSIAYDWLYYDLSYKDRVAIHDALVSNAMTPSTSASFHTMYNNWNQVCNAGVVAAALALYEKDKSISVTVIENALSSNKTAMQTIYSPDGNYSEGYGYWGYGTGFEVTMLQMLDKIFGSMNGLEETSGFMDTSEYMLFMAGTTNKDFPYADGGGNAESPQIAMWWFAAKEENPALLLNEWRMYDNDYYNSDEDETRLLPLVPCVITQMDDTSILDADSTTPDKNIWYGNGTIPVCMVHTGWNFDANDYYLGIKGGYAQSNHGHMDAGSFVYDSQGVRWSEDLTRPSYSTIETALSAVGGNFWTMTQSSLRWDVYRMNNLAHSTISFEANNGSVSKVHTTDHIVGGSATISEVYDDSDVYGAKLDMTLPLSDAVDAAYRTFQLIDGDLYITDQITAKSGFDAPMQWRMLTKATTTIEDDNSLITLTNDSKTLYMTVTADPATEVTFTTWSATRPSTWTSRSWDSSNSGYSLCGYTATIPAGTTVSFTTKLSATNQ